MIERLRKPSAPAPEAELPEPGTVGEPFPAEAGIAVDDDPPETWPTPPEPEDTTERACGEVTAAGKPCKGRAGPDGRCAAHKRAKGR